MLRVGRILKDFADAGSVNSMLAPWAFVDDHAFITKAGHVGLAYRLEGVDFECLDAAQRRDIAAPRREPHARAAGCRRSRERGAQSRPRL